MKRAFILTGILALLPAWIAAADPGDTLWTRTYGGNDPDYGYCVQQTTDGGYIIAGETASFGAGSYDVYLVKTDANGDTLWIKTYGGSGSDDAYFVQQTTDGGYIFAGSTTSFGGGRFDVYLVKTDADGNTLWTRAYGGSDYDEARSVHETTDGGYIVVGSTRSFGAGGWDTYLLKTNADGDTLWTRTYGGSEYDDGWSGQQTADGGYIVVGMSESFGPAADVYLVKTDADGNTLWTRTYGGSAWEIGSSVQQTADGGYIIGGSTHSFGANGDVYLVKTDADGDTLWTRHYGGAGLDEANCVQQTREGGYIIAAYTTSFGAGRDDVYLLKTDANGDTLWTRTYGGSDTDWGYSVRQTSDGNYIVAGYTESFGAGSRDVYLVKVAGEVPEPDISIEIVPDDPPVTVPQGERFGYIGSLTNNTNELQVTDVWVMAVGPLEGVYGPFKELHDFPLDPGQTRSDHFNQRVPNLAPLGFYDYIAYCGDYPSTVMDSSFFQIEVVAGEGSGNTGWALTGSFLEGDLADIPSEFALLSNYPNPFNTSTVISYELPTDTHVKLEVYNISGQKVATLVDSKQQSGYRSVVWDGSEVSSGVYSYKLTAPDYTEVKTMTLLR